jgi:hypothetical protein
MMKDSSESESNELEATKHEVLCSILTVQVSVKPNGLLVLHNINSYSLEVAV